MTPILTRLASADRRPVDPPPVVSLNIFDLAKGEDITMSYDSGFMLYASLEVARPIANGKMHSGPPCLPVLTGVCVASTAYLERPQRAGYFIFPDLSVRHEGWYRLKFSLFEQIKHSSDADVDRPFTGPEAPGQQVLKHESMANRMEVQSTPFQVFSAKKFPGLSQSTDLSKVVADQGCRVRIRREIRQRKQRVLGDDKPESGRQTPDLWTLGHNRADSRNSNYAPVDPIRRASMESIYHRQSASRAPSISSLSQASPTTPTAPTMAPMPPPMHKAWDQPPPPAPPSYPASLLARYSAGYYQQPAPTRPGPAPENLTLPPISPVSTSTALASPSRYYQTAEPTPMKRGSDRAYNDGYSMKAGARPDQPTRAEPVQTHGIIEPDNGEDEDADKGDYSYSRANGSRGLKVAQLLS